MGLQIACPWDELVRVLDPKATLVNTLNGRAVHDMQADGEARNDGNLEVR